MDKSTKLLPGQAFAPVTFRQLGGGEFTFGAARSWEALFVIRGQHCPICKSYLSEIEQRREVWERLPMSVAAVSADSEQQSWITADAAKVTFPLLYGMNEETMHKLGLYVSQPRSPEETDHRFPEPALFVVNPQGILQLVDIANAPFLRPDLDRLARGLAFVIDKGYPVRGTVR